MKLEDALKISKVEHCLNNHNWLGGAAIHPMNEEDKCITAHATNQLFFTICWKETLAPVRTHITTYGTDTETVIADDFLIHSNSWEPLL